MKMKHYYNTADGEYISTFDLMSLWINDAELRNEYENFNLYVDACQSYNGGMLDEIHTNGETMVHYFETVHEIPGHPYKIRTAHETFEHAAFFADNNGIWNIAEIGGHWQTFTRCHFCGEWFTGEHNEYCERCERTLNEHT